MAESPEQFLQQAALESATVTLSLPMASGVTLRRSTVVSCDANGVCVSIAEEDVSLVSELIRRQAAVLVAVRSANGDILFHSVPRSVDSASPASQSNRCRTLLLAMPAKVVSTQRRKTFRLPIAPADGVQLRLWRINEYVLVRDRPLPSQEFRCELQNLGEGGMRAVLFPRSEEAMHLKAGQRFRVELRVGKNEMLFDARLRYPLATDRDDTQATCGLEFMHSDRDVESRRHRQKLQLVLAELQRQAALRGAA